MTRDYECPTKDMSKFGYREIAEAGRLLTAYAEQGCDHLGDGVAVWFNQESGNVFLSDEDYNVAMINGDKIEPFYTCPYCGHEGFLEEMEHDPAAPDCTEYLESIGQKTTTRGAE